MKNVLDDAESRMKKCLSVLQSDYSAVRAGRAYPAVLD